MGGVERVCFNRILKDHKLRSQAVFLVSLVLLTSMFSVWIDRTERKLYGVKPGVSVEGYQVGRYLLRELIPVIDELVIKHRRMPKNATINRENGEIIPEVYGQEVDPKATINAVMADPPNARVKLITTEIKPKFLSSDLAVLNHIIGEYHIWCYGSLERLNNLKLAAKSLNNLVVWPENIFSFNEVVGPRTPERGYLPAPVVGGDGIGFGGGVCQVSTTLYNAVTMARLPVIERHRHSKTVPYVNPGLDAAVVYGAQDFRFLNDRDYPVIIKAEISRGKVIVKIIGK